jgi:hypothetical protein
MKKNFKGKSIMCYIMCQIEGSSCEGNFNCTDNTLGTVMFGGFT